MSTLPAWQTFSPPIEESLNSEIGDPAGATVSVDPTDPDYDPTFVCTTTPYSLATNPSKVITMSGALGLLVPGKLLQGAPYVDGELRTLPIAEREPVRLTISLNNLVGDAFRLVNDPSEGTLKTAVNELIQAAETSAFQAGSSVSFQQATSYAFDQAALGMGLSVRYMGGSVEGSLASKTSAERLTITASFVPGDFGLAEFFAEDASLTTYVPISYTLRNLSDNSIAGVGETSNYTLTECEPITQTILSDFEEDRDGWTAVDARGIDPVWENPAGFARVGTGYLEMGDPVNGVTGYYVAPSKFLGDKSEYVGGSLSYWFEWVQSGTHGSPFSDPDMVIRGVSTPKGADLQLGTGRLARGPVAAAQPRVRAPTQAEGLQLWERHRDGGGGHG